MTGFDRAEWTGTGAAIAFHVALIAALSTSLASVDSVPEPPSMEVELVEEVSLQSASPEPPAPPPPSQAPEMGQQAEPLPPPPAAEALAPPPPAPKPIPTPQVDAAERRQAQIAADRRAKAAAAKPAAAKPAPAKPTAKPAPASSAPRVSRLGDDFLKGIEGSDAESTPSRPAARFDAQAQASVARLIADQIRPCAEQQRELGPGANRIQVTLNLQLFPSGRLKRSPTVVRVTGDDADNAQYVDLVVNQAIASYRQCSPLRLPAELYQTPQGGWANINMRYKVP
jgi:hypothetical protein